MPEDGPIGSPQSLEEAQAPISACLRIPQVSAIAPPDAPGLHEGQSLLFRFGYFACRHMQWLVRWLVRMEARAFRANPIKGLREAGGKRRMRACMHVRPRSSMHCTQRRSLPQKPAVACTIRGSPYGCIEHGGSCMHARMPAWTHPGC